eukprot:1157129-Pelagomonas_calceolata.AAC.4
MAVFGKSSHASLTSKGKWRSQSTKSLETKAVSPTQLFDRLCRKNTFQLTQGALEAPSPWTQRQHPQQTSTIVTKVCTHSSHISKGTQRTEGIQSLATRDMRSAVCSGGGCKWSIYKGKKRVNEDYLVGKELGVVGLPALSMCSSAELLKGSGRG